MTCIWILVRVLYFADWGVDLIVSARFSGSVWFTGSGSSSGLCLRAVELDARYKVL